MHLRNALARIRQPTGLAVALTLVSVAVPLLTVLLTFWITPQTGTEFGASEVAWGAVAPKLVLALLLAPAFETPLILLQAQALVSVFALRAASASLTTAITWACLHSILRDEGLMGVSAILTLPLFLICVSIYFALHTASLAVRVSAAVLCHFLWNATTLTAFLFLSDI